MKKFFKKLTSNKKVFIGLLILIGFLVFIVVGAVNNRKNKKESSNVGVDTSDSSVSISDDESSVQENSNLLVAMQPDLESKFGKAPEGYIWEVDGTLMSLGDKNLTAEEVVYTYLNGLRTLDFYTVQKFSRNSQVVSTYSGYFDSVNRNTDYYTSFLRSVYKYCLLSFYVKSVDNSSIFAENKQVFTVKLSMLDLTKKDFWEKDKDEIYKNLEIYKSEQGDSTKADIYLYDYLTRYYSSDDAFKRDVSFDIVVEKYPDLDTGWLVSVDTDVDSACRYADGKLIVEYINEVFSNERYDYFKKD